MRLMPTQADHRATAAMPGSPSPRPPNGPAAAAAAAAERRNGSNSARLQALLRGQGTGLANPFTANGYEVSQVGQDSRVARSAEKNKFLYFSGRPGGPEIQGGHQVQRLARPCSPGGATWDFAHDARRLTWQSCLLARVAEGGQSPRAPRFQVANCHVRHVVDGGRQHVSHEAYCHLSHVRISRGVRGVLPRGNMAHVGIFILLQSQVASTWARGHGQGQSVPLMK